MIRLLMAVSADGFVARDDKDDMKWTGLTDKNVFKLLTSVGCVCAVGKKTFALMPELPERRVIPISRSGEGGMTLDELYEFARKRDIWLLGGQTVALRAIHKGMVAEVYVSKVVTVQLSSGIRAGFLDTTKRYYTHSMEFKFDDLLVTKYWGLL